MDLLVLIKETISTDQDLNKGFGKLKRIINPYDEYALQKACELKEKFGGTITTILLKSDDDLYTLKTTLGLGSDKGIQIISDSNNSRNIVNILKNEILKSGKYDFIFTGVKDVNDPKSEIPTRLACSLDLPILNYVLGIDIINEEIIFNKETDEYTEDIKLKTPSIVAFCKNVYEPKYPTIHQIMDIQNKPITVINSKDKKFKDLDLRVIINKSQRRCEIYKNLISPEEGAEKIVNYLKTWTIGE